MTKQIFDFELPKESLNSNQLIQLIQILKTRVKPGARAITLRLRNNGKLPDAAAD